MQVEDEEKRIRSAALQNVQSILLARQRAEQELLRTKEALEEETRILELLNKTGAALASQLDLQSLVQAVTDAATQLSGAQFGAFFYTVTGDDPELFSLYALSGAPREAFPKLGHPRATPIFAPTFRGEGPIRIGDVRQDSRYGQMSPHDGVPEGHLPVRSYLAVPVVARSGEVLGGLFFGHQECNVFSERAERLIVAVAAQAAIAMDNARLYELAKRSADERARLLEFERAARAEIERVSVVKDEFLATLSHELRTPLNAVLGWAQTLLMRAKDNDDIRHGLETISRNARAQARLIEDLLDMNRIATGKLRLDVQRVELAQVVEAVLESARPSMDAKSISVGMTLDPRAGVVFGDPNRLQQVVWNLLSNAVKFTPKGGRINLLVQRVNSHVAITVHDSGIGISSEFLPHLFERFRQADSSTTRRYGGLGLGLSIVKQLVELHGGSVEALSDGRDQGSTFVVNLPVRADAADSERERPASSQRPPAPSLEVSLAGLKVLIIDDEPDARELLRFVLSDACAEVITASSADEGIALVKAHLPNVLLSNLGMPDCDGYELMGRVRRLPAAQGGGTPAIALSTFARAQDRTRALLAGYQAHLSKPIEPQELVAAIKSLARHHDQAHER